jgi:ApbE superfamily uncharacterized protein (UPF0280 family)
MEATRSLLSDGRWHFQHGPIDLVIGADGEPAAVGRALERLWQRFRQVLPELVGELSDLRQPIVDEIVFNGPVAQRMFDACWPHRRAFITPMAAVAGSVADELMQYFRQEASIARAYINNGGDIALHLQPGQRYRVGLFADLARFTGDTPVLDGNFEIANELPVRGIATSGWRGRSFSLGIADSVTVLAATAAGADAAATMIANQVNVEHPAIVRAAASDLKDDTDLGDLAVTVDVGILPQGLVQQALWQGVQHATLLVQQNLIFGAVLVLQGQAHAVGLNQSERALLQAA